MDTQVQIWAPPAADNAAVQDDFGAIDRSVANWTRRGQPLWAAITAKSSTDTPINGQAADSQIYAVETEYVAGFDESWRLEILNGPNKGRYLYPASLPFSESRVRLMTLTCRLARKT